MLYQHTPGPWSVGDARKMRQQLVTGAGVAIMAHSPKWGEAVALFNLRTNDSFGGTETTLANARLIAAAPELLAALEKYVDDDDIGARIQTVAFKQARAALAKARGEVR